jgi:hypothetical protein
MVIDEFDGTVVEKEVIDDFETSESIPNSMPDQKINSGTHDEREKYCSI